MVKKHPTSFHLTSTDGSSSPAKGAQRSWQLRSMTGFNIEVFSSLHYLTAVATGLPVSTLITFLAITNIKLLVCGRVSHLQRAMMLVPHFTRQPKPSGRTQNSLPRLGHPPSPSPQPSLSHNYLLTGVFTPGYLRHVLRRAGRDMRMGWRWRKQPGVTC